MSSVASAAMVPHPPIILPNIGRGEEKKISEVDHAYRKAGEMIVQSRPETVVIVSPHAPSYYDYIQISSGRKAFGDLGQFRDEEDAFEVEYDQELIHEICRLADEEQLPAGTLGRQDGSLDHGTMIPLYYLKDLPKQTRFIRIGTGGVSSRMHYQLGTLIQKAADNLGRKIAVIGSGDLSHCQKAGTHYGYKECGPAYDARIMEIMSAGDFESLLALSDEEAEESMVCGQKPFCVMAGVMDGLLPESQGLAHSAEFGVGYGICTYDHLKEDSSRSFLQKAEEKARAEYLKRTAKEDDYVALARNTIENLIAGTSLSGRKMQMNEELLHSKAGAFVSIHENGQLRGCIGTTSPTCSTLAEEIMQNAQSASLRDPRFPAIQPYELEDLHISVDVLKAPEPVQSKDGLDVKKYGVIVSKNGRRGLLLPDLEGVDTVEKQISIAKQKAGIDELDDDVQLERFEVIRHV
ncbi:MAG: AmmeMemoRadiSam system protein A [Erysipelotrichaceae bacterium]|nr:AmmeMemoRadiSam system protein A [Erysipelotrichaceae bacterium]